MNIKIFANLTLTQLTAKKWKLWAVCKQKQLNFMATVHRVLQMINLNILMDLHNEAANKYGAFKRHSSFLA